ncbi:twin-arginine translocase subunit TatC [Phosphitispora sp. TUW77]|uniref:twin-arginine translocase subunit TatC n=1 Tax=Phosphitispora sp. TUW77 TaxID=3152361 RepID=UPI003AB66788
MSILDHLEALRRVVIISFISIIPGAVVGWMIRERILAFLVLPVKKLEYDLVFITATEALTAYMKISLVAGLIIASPVIAYQFWKFVLPALHAHEKRYLIIFMPVSVLLFVGGIAFAYYSVFVYAVGFLLSFGGEGLSPMLSLNKYLSFTIWFLLPFGAMFELPLVIIILARLGIVTPGFLASKRKFALLAIFVIAAVVTPTTDMITQGIMGGAMYLLYEISIWLAYLVRPGRKKKIAVPETEVDNSEDSK